MRSDIMWAIDQSLRVNRGKPREPFGGVRLAMFGDDVDEGRADDHAVCHLGDGASLFGRAHAEADRAIAGEEQGQLFDSPAPARARSGRRELTE